MCLRWLAASRAVTVLAGFPDVILAYHMATRTHLGGEEIREKWDG